MSSEEKRVVARELGAMEDDGGRGGRSDTDTIDVPLTYEDPDIDTDEVSDNN